jgi:hypothetical protein
MSRRSKLLVAVAFVLFVVSLYGLAGVLQAAMFFVGLKALRNANLWGSLAIVALTGAISCLWIALPSSGWTARPSRFYGSVLGGLVALGMALLVLWPVIRDFIAIDGCIDGGRSFDYVRSVCDMSANHPSVSLPEYQGFRLVATIIFGIPGALLLIAAARVHHHNARVP